MRSESVCLFPAVRFTFSLKKINKVGGDDLYPEATPATLVYIFGRDCATDGKARESLLEREADDCTIGH